MNNSQKFKRVFLITVDALRADHVGFIGGGNLTPNIDKIANSSALFLRAFANGPGTNQSFPAIMTSTYFTMHNGFYSSPHYATLAEVLQENGFKTVGFHSNPFLSKTFGWDRGFDEFYDFMNELKSPSAFVTSKQGTGITNRLIRFLASSLGGTRYARLRQFMKNVYYIFSGLEIPYLEGEILNKNVFDWVDRNLDEKFFLWMHYMDTHYPYIPPEDYLHGFSTRREAFKFNMDVDLNNPSPDEIETLKELYRDEVRYIDSCLGNFFKFLEDRGLIEESLIVITSDHGEAFMEHDRVGHKPDSLYNEVLHVPLLIYGLDNSFSTDFPVQLLDVPVTILDILQIKNAKTFLGDSLTSLVEKNCLNRSIFSESAKPDLINLKYDLNKKAVSCIKDGWKLIVNELSGTNELYNIDKDFEEKNNLIEKEKQVSQELTKLIEKHLYIVKKTENSYS